MPFTLRETRQYLESLDVRLDNRQLTEIYMALGGIPAYLQRVRPGLSSAQIINELCFTEGRFLVEEFDRLYASLFSNHRKHVQIVRALASAPRGLKRGDVLKKAGLAIGGSSSQYLKELEQSGFISTIPQYGRKKRGQYYRLSDEYSLFYLKWIETAKPISGIAHDSDYWLRQSQRPSWTSWAGYAFEGICLKHVSEIKRGLGISGVVSRAYSWECPPERGQAARGAQVDLVIERADSTTNLCELKFVRDLFEVSADYRRELVNKRERFRAVTGTRALLLNTLLTTYGAKENKNYIGVVDNQLTLDIFFS